MAKFLKIAFPQKCNGCELCVMEVQRQLKKIGLDGSLIRVFRNPKNMLVDEGLVCSVDMDVQVNAMDIKKIKAICPTGVFTIEEGDITSGLIN